MMRVLPFLVCLLLSAGVARAEELVVFAAASLKAALDPAVVEFATAGGDRAVVSYAASPALARQIEYGAPADVVLLAAVDWMDYLQKRDLIVSGSQRNLWGNSLSLIAHDLAAPPLALDGSQDIAAYLVGGRLAMALVDSVPVGRYGKQALERLGQWPAIAPQVVQAQDARAVVALVASGQAEYGLVYASDARALAALGQGAEVGRFPEGSHDPIIYPAAVVAGTPNQAQAGAFLDFLQGNVAAAIFAAQGYVVLPR